MRVFLILIFLAFLLNEKVCSQNIGNRISDIKAYVKAVDSLSDIKTYLLQDKATLHTKIIEGVIKYPKRKLKGGFSNTIVTSNSLDTILIKHHDNLEKNLYESYYYKSDKLVFSKIEIHDDGANAVLFSQEVYYLNDKIIYSTIDKNILRKKYKWRTDFDPLANAYSYLNDFKANKE